MKLGQNKTFIIAELSANHNNDLSLALDTVQAIAESGADAVKVQTYKPESLTIDVENEYFFRRTEGLWKGYLPYELYKEAAMPYEWHIEIKKKAEEFGLTFFSSPFDKEGADFLEGLDVPLYKIASFEIQDIPLIEYVAAKGKPIIMSTGIAELGDIQLAIQTCKNVGNENIALLKCTSAYPTPMEEVNLNVITNMKEAFGVEVGLSDHTMGSTAPLGAVALGATIIEKHFILDRKLGGVDSAFSMEPAEFKFMVDSIRDLEKALGKVTYELSDKVKISRSRGRSLFISEDIQKGEVISEQNCRSVRPGAGLHPKHLPSVIGKKAAKNIQKGTPLSWDLLGD